jgi:predicted amidophosphoribosyltransferase
LKKKPRFFCDNCGSEVDRNAKACPHCGRFFASIRCPACGFAGAERLFAGGCPSCGYSAPPGDGAKLREKKPAAGPLPMWVYVFSIAALIAVLAILFFAITK